MNGLSKNLLPPDTFGRTYGVYETDMEQLAKQRPQGQFTQVDAGHEVFYSSEAVAAIRQLIAGVRDPRQWDISATPGSGTPQP